MNCTIDDFYFQAGIVYDPNSTFGGGNVATGAYLIPSSINFPTNVSQGVVSTNGYHTLAQVFVSVAIDIYSHHNYLFGFYQFMSNVWSTYSNHNDPCNYLLNRYNHFNNQLSNNTYSSNQTFLKSAKRDYFAHMYTFCGCGTMPTSSPLPPATPLPPLNTNQTPPEVDFVEKYNEDL